MQTNFRLTTLGTIEWYHRLRNQLYHEGFGLTVTRDNVDVYAELANALFKNLFGFDLLEAKSFGANERLGEMVQLWNTLERGLIEHASTNDLLGNRRSPMDAIRFLNGAAIIEDTEMDDLNYLRQIRNEVVHGQEDHRKVLTDEVIGKLRKYAERFKEDDTPPGER